uniref:Uncharacterized protein n=1 Tax=Photinus pyralis TaxID=7054 RepID=A0A1Y1MPR5_PHOPY
MHTIINMRIIFYEHNKKINRYYVDHFFLKKFIKVGWFVGTAFFPFCALPLTAFSFLFTSDLSPFFSSTFFTSTLATSPFSLTTSAFSSSSDPLTSTHSFLVITYPSSSSNVLSTSFRFLFLGAGSGFATGSSSSESSITFLRFLDSSSFSSSSLANISSSDSSCTTMRLRCFELVLFFVLFLFLLLVGSGVGFTTSESSSLSTKCCILLVISLFLVSVLIDSVASVVDLLFGSTFLNSSATLEPLRDDPGLTLADFGLCLIPFSTTGILGGTFVGGVGLTMDVTTGLVFNCRLIQLLLTIEPFLQQ